MLAPVENLKGPSNCGPVVVTTDMPHGPPPAAIVHGKFAYGRMLGGGAFNGASPCVCCVGHFALKKMPQIKPARNDASGAEASYKTSYEVGGGDFFNCFLKLIDVE